VILARNFVDPGRFGSSVKAASPPNIRTQRAITRGCCRKVNRILDQKMTEDHSVSLLNVGSCGLHTVHNSFKAGAEATGWKVSSVLSSMYYLFKDSPARREDFTEITGSTRYPMKFVSHRWLENVSVATRAIEMWGAIQMYVRVALTKKVSRPSCSSFDTLAQAVQDKLFIPKMTFFRSMAEHCLPFLKDFQTDKPVMPFVSEALSDLIRSLMRRFIKPDTLDAAKTPAKLVSIDITDTSIHLPHSKIDVGFRTKHSLQQVPNKSERDMLTFRMECKDFLIQILKKLLAKCPLNFPLVQALSCLSPNLMVTDSGACRCKFRKMLDALVKANRVQEQDCDEAVRQFESFLDSVPVLGSDEFTSFNRKTDRLDSFLLDRLQARPDKYALLIKVTKMVLVLSHGQAAVERGFSVNKEIEVENLNDKSLVAQRIVCDYVRVCGGVLEVPMTKELLQSASNSRQRYSRYLEEQRAATKIAESAGKRKRVLDELESLKKKQKRTEDDISTLEFSADELNLKVEHSTGKIKEVLALVTQSNSLRKTVRGKREILKGIQSDIVRKQQELRLL